MSTQHPHSHPRRTGLWRHVGLAAAVLASAGLVGCTMLQTPAAAPTQAADDTPPLPTTGDTALEAGTYRVDAFAAPLEITVPDGWVAKDGWLLLNEPTDGQAVFLTFLKPAYVPTDSCAWSGTVTDAGTSVDEFADALAAQTSTTTTDPTEVTSGDARGVEFDLAVEGGIDIADCDREHVCIHSESSYDCTRYYQSVTRRETYRVLDVRDERAVISVGQDEGAPAVLVDEARAIFDSIEFQADE